MSESAARSTHLVLECHDEESIGDVLLLEHCEVACDKVCLTPPGGGGYLLETIAACIADEPHHCKCSRPGFRTVTAL